MSTTKNDKPAYQESEDHVANPMYQSGVVDTTGTTGDVGSRMDNVSPVFAQARRDALGNAADAVKNHPKGDLDHVVLPEDDLTRDEAQERLEAKAKEAEENPQLHGGKTPGEAQAEEEGEEGQKEGQRNEATASTTRGKAAARKTTAHKPSAKEQAKTGEAKDHPAGSPM